MKKKNNIIAVSKITSKNQVTIPKTIREVLNVKSSDEIVWALGADGQITVKKISPEKDKFWKIVDEQEKKYGSVDTPEVNLGKDVGLEDFD
ncbi:type II toxin-antitoxin system PrlF family antitoxin [Lentilactobacillus raoultii]|uniref:Type II toxin-antitoxin system PrlF family antitoxin n=1 Tax=Lentilactobacillus raoultii TaxID=1987503 RepID=A0ABW3PFD8_9LACO|nr:type II toxin-antitoxin system PrlF family antitoxin [Lentilactobacillus raoultii]